MYFTLKKDISINKMKGIKHGQLLKRLFQKEKPIKLGRCGTVNPGRKAELANHDNCGGEQCSPTALTSDWQNDNDFTLCALQSFQLHQNPAKLPTED